MSEEKERRPLISRDTVIPLGIAISVVGVASMSAWKVSGELATNTVQTSAKFESIDHRLKTVAERLERLSDDLFRRTDMQVWVELMKARHPEIKWSDVK